MSTTVSEEKLLISPNLNKKHDLKLKARYHTIPKFSLETTCISCGEHADLQGNLHFRDGQNISEQLKSLQFWKLSPLS